jgi:hypothetical protein
MSDQKLKRISLVLNMVLAAVCLTLVLRRPAANPNPTTLPQSSPPASAADSARVSTAVKRENSNRAEPRNWIEVLRERGVPEKVIARLAVADFEDRWQARQAQAQEAYHRGDLDSEGLAALAQQHDLEEENDLRAKLGDDAFRRWDQERLFQQFNLSNMTLTTAETNSLYELAANHRVLLRGVEKARLQDQMDQATYDAEQAKAQTDFEKQLRALLGDGRYGALRGESPTVGDLRRSLRGVDLDDRQFATLLEAQEKWDAARAQLEQQQVETSDTNLGPQINALTEKRDQAFASVLGTNGFALFQKQQDSRYLEMQKNAARWGLDGSSIDYIYDAIQTYEQAAGEYERKVREIEGQTIKADADALHQNLRSYGRQLAQSLRTNLGDARYDAVRRNQLLPFDQEK